LVVDDDAAVRDSLKFLLELEGFLVRVFQDGRALLKEPDIHGDEYLVIDQIMPGLTGLETIDAVRRRGGHHPVVLVISEPSVAVLNGAKARGVTVLEKPFLERVLVDAIRKTMDGPS